MGGGLIGALFIKINIFIAKFRKAKINKSRFLRVIEVLIVSFIGSSLQFWLPAAFTECHEIGDPIDGIKEYYVSYIKNYLQDINAQKNSSIAWQH